MIDGKKILGLITARGGSKGVPGKNIRPVGGKPLIAWTIDAAKKSKYIDRLILSSDDNSIMKVAEKYGCEVPFQREAILAADDTPSIDVVIDALDRFPDFDLVVLLQPTSPLRTTTDIDEAILKCINLNAKACVSVMEAEHSPFWMYFQKDNKLVPVINKPLIERRQDLPKAYSLNGCVYVSETTWLRQTKSFLSDETVLYEMPKSRSIDIDTEDDFTLLEMYLEKIKEV